MNSKKFFLLAALLVICFGAHVTEAAVARKPIRSCQTIDESGSYLLAQNLTGTGDCLVLTVDNVTIDLNGFTIEGDRTGNGIWDGDVAHQNITIRNGVVTNFIRGVKVDFSSYVTIEGIHAVKNAVVGIRAGSNSIIKDNIANDNGSLGIFANKGSLVTGNVANNNILSGLRVVCASSIIGNTATGNTKNIEVGGSGCTFYNNNPAP